MSSFLYPNITTYTAHSLCFQVTILTFGLFTFVPAIQRFCIFAVVGLLSDFFMQMTFYVSTLSLFSIPVDTGKYYHNAMQTPSQGIPAGSFSTILRSKSHPRLNGLVSQSTDRYVPTTFRIIL